MQDAQEDGVAFEEPPDEEYEGCLTEGHAAAQEERGVQGANGGSEVEGRRPEERWVARGWDVPRMRATVYSLGGTMLGEVVLEIAAKTSATTRSRLEF